MAASLDDNLGNSVSVFCEHISPLVKSGITSFQSEKKPDVINVKEIDMASQELVRFCRQEPQLTSEVDWDFFVLPDESTYKVIDHLLRMRSEGKVRDIAFIRLAVSWVNGQIRR